MKLITLVSVKNKSPLISGLSLGILFSSFFLTPLCEAVDDVGAKTKAAAAMFANVGTAYTKNIIYINGENLKNNSNILSFKKLKERVIRGENSYFFDFSAINHYKDRDAAKKTLQQLFGVRFDEDMVLIGLYKNDLIFTPMYPDEAHLMRQALSRNTEEQKKRNRDPVSYVGKAETSTLPHVAFYLDVNQKISDKKCSFPISHVWDRGEKSFCHQANIALVYRVNLMRSLTHGTVGSATPDAKLVRISLDEESAGAGIQLNSALSAVTSDPGQTAFNGWARTYTTSAIAKDYKFSLSASNNKASILKTFPASNLNASYQNVNTSGFEVGVSGGTESSKAKLEAKYSYNQSRSLVYHTQDYRVERSASNGQNISFTWARDQYSTAESLLSKKTGPIWDYEYPVDSKRIRPTSYQGFVPNFDVIYRAAPSTAGTTTFTIDSSVNIWPVYTAAFTHYYVLGGHIFFQGQEAWQKYHRVGKGISFDVDWNHPVFTGGRPVNLQLGGFNNMCIGYGDKAAVEMTTCDLNSAAQSFIYDQYGRYQSAVETGKCLDSSNLGEFQTCNASLSQRWKWVKDTDLLQNEFRDQYLGHDTQRKRLVSVPQGSINIGVRTITKFTDIFGT